MSTFRMVVVFFLGLMLFITGSLAVFYLPFEAILMNPDTYNSALNSQKIYSKAPIWIGEILSRQKLPAGQGTQMELARYALSAFRPEDYAALVRIVATEGYLQQSSEKAISQVFNFLNQKSNELRVDIDLREIKSKLSGKSAEEIIKLVFSTLPACKPADLLKLPLPGQPIDPAKLPYCQPPAVTQSLIYPLLTGEVEKFAVMFPDKFFLTNEVFPASFSQTMKDFWNFRSWFAVLFFGSIGLSILLGILCFVPYRSMRPLGIPLISVGLFSIILVVSAAVVSTPLIKNIMQNMKLPDINFLPEIVGVILGVLSQFFFWSATIGVAITAIGIILTFIIKPSQPKLEWYQTGFHPSA